MTNGTAPGPELPKMPESEISPDEVSSIEADRLAYERSAEHKDDILHAEKKAELEAMKETHLPSASDDESGGSAPMVSKDEVVLEVEHILEDGIGPFYESLPEEAKPIFKKKGEEAANEIAGMVASLKANLKRIVTLISNWLKTVPGVNKYFLEQEAKIKADRILELIEARKNDFEPKL